MLVMVVIDKFFYPTLYFHPEVDVDVVLPLACARVYADKFEPPASFTHIPEILSEKERLGLETERLKLFCGDVLVRELATTRDRAHVREVRALDVDGPSLKGVSDALADGSKVLERIVVQVGIARGARGDRRRPRAHASDDVRERREHATHRVLTTARTVTRARGARVGSALRRIWIRLRRLYGSDPI